VTFLVIGVSVSTSEKSTDSSSTLSAKRITAVFFILFAVIIAMATYFLTKEGGLLTSFFGPKTKSAPAAERMIQSDCPSAPAFSPDSPF
jgi:hypothetical protein